MFTIRLFSLHIDFRLQKREVDAKKVKQISAINQIENVITTHRNKHIMLKPFF